MLKEAYTLPTDIFLFNHSVYDRNLVIRHIASKRYSARIIPSRTRARLSAHTVARNSFSSGARAVIYASQLFNSEIIECIVASCARSLASFLFFPSLFFPFLFFPLSLFTRTVDRQLRDYDQRPEPITRPLVLISIIHTRFASSRTSRAHRDRPRPESCSCARVASGVPLRIRG